MKDRGVTRVEDGDNASSAGFSLLELAITILILGLVLSIGAVAYANISQGMKLQSAKKQVEAALTRAKLSARQENVEYHVVFYPDGAGNQNTYEFLCYMHDEMTDTWSLQPTDKSITGENTVSSEDHVYAKMGNEAKIVNTETVTVIFRPTGTEQVVSSIAEGESGQTINIQVGSRTGSVTIDAQGRITQG